MSETSVTSCPSETRWSDAPNLRVRQMRFPQTRTVYRTLVVILVTLGAAMLVLGAVVRFDFGSEFSLSWLIQGSVVYVMILAGVSFLAWRQRQLRMNVPRNRFVRLEKLVKSPQAKARFPHRVIEYQFRKSPDRALPRALKALKELPQGTVIVANAAAGIPFVLPGRSSVAFEPVSLSKPDDGLVNLLELGLIARLEEDPAVAGRSESQDVQPARRGRTISLVGACALLAIMLTVLGWAIRAVAQSGTILVCVPLVLVIVVVVYLGPLFGEREWWLVPGGLVGRRSPFWRTRAQLIHVRGHEAVLFLDLRAHSCLVVHRGRVYTLMAFSLLWAWALLSGLLSLARPPSEEEINDLFEGRAHGTRP